LAIKQKIIDIKMKIRIKINIKIKKKIRRRRKTQSNCLSMKELKYIKFAITRP